MAYPYRSITCPHHRPYRPVSRQLALKQASEVETKLAPTAWSALNWATQYTSLCCPPASVTTDREPMTAFSLNGRTVSVDLPGDTPLLTAIRNELALFGSRFGCGAEQCGACMMLI